MIEFDYGKPTHGYKLTEAEWQAHLDLLAAAKTALLDLKRPDMWGREIPNETVKRLRQAIAECEKPWAAATYWPS